MDKLGLEPPFETIEVVGVTASSAPQGPTATELPSASPTQFPALTDEDCAAIILGLPVDGEEVLEDIDSYDLFFELTVPNEKAEYTGEAANLE